MTKIQMHKAMGLAEEDMEAIDDEIQVLLEGTRDINDAAAKIAEAHDAKAVLIGMRFLQLIQLNDEIAEARRAKERMEEKTNARKTLIPPPDPSLS